MVYSSRTHLEMSDDGHVKISGDIPTLGGERNGKGRSSGPSLQKLDHLPGQELVDESIVHAQKANAIYREKGIETEEMGEQTDARGDGIIAELTEDPVNLAGGRKKETQNFNDGEKIAKVAMAK